MEIIRNTEKGIEGIDAQETDCKRIRSVGSPLAEKILKRLSAGPSYPLQIARMLGVNEQKVYYHMHNLEQKGIIKRVRRVEQNGLMVNYYALSGNSFFIRFAEFRHMAKVPAEAKGVLSNFIHGGKLDAVIIMGSPEPHGPEMAKGRDVIAGMDLALFLGAYLSNYANGRVMLDTEAGKDALRQNMIVVGGPAVNKVCRLVNEHMPVFFDSKKKWAIRSGRTKKAYEGDTFGIAACIKSPFAPGRHILLLGGKRLAGTKAAIIALMQEKLEGNYFAHIVEGVDADSDGIIDAVEIRE